MKRLFAIGLMLASAFALTNCSEQLVSPELESDNLVDGNIETPIPQEEGEIFEFFICEGETKTMNDNGGHTIWEKDMDHVFLYSKNADAGYTRHGEFTYVGNQKFSGQLHSGYKLSSKNDWFCIYPHTGSSSGATETVNETLTIGASAAENYTQHQNPISGSKKHLAGPNYPMYGKAVNVEKKKSPTFKMNYLFSVVGIELENNAEGEDLVIQNVGFKAPEAIVGQFNVDITGATPAFTPITSAVSNVAKLQFNQPLTLKTGESTIVYLAVKPFVAAAKSKITIYANGSYKEIETTAATSFEAGKVTTIKVPINNINSTGKFGPISSNLLGETGYGAIYDEAGNVSKVDNITHINLSHPTPHTMIINGQVENNVFILGDENGNLGTVTITGTPAKLIQYAPLGFYVSSWNDEQAIMRVESITAHVKTKLGTIPLTFTWEDLTESIIKDKKKIQFAGMVQLEQVVESGNTHLVILDDEPYHKMVSEKKINDLLANFDDNKADDEGEIEYIPTLAGLKAALNDVSSLPAATGNFITGYTVPALNTLNTPRDITAYIVWSKIKTKIGSKISETVASALFKSPKDMFEMVANQPAIVVLSTRPNGEVSEADPTVIATDPRIVVWGLSSYSGN